jgi:hypothetical protein
MKEISKDPHHVIIERIHECMRSGLGGNQVQYDEELAKLVDACGVDFVSQHACEEMWAGGEECPAGRCERPCSSASSRPDHEDMGTVHRPPLPLQRGEVDAPVNPDSCRQRCWRALL